MAKKGGKFLALAAVAAAAATYYYMKKKNETIPVDMEDEDVDNFNDDFDDDVDRTRRNYVNLDFDKVEKTVKDAAGVLSSVASKAASQVGNILSQAEGKVEEFFDDRKAQANMQESGVSGEELEDTDSQIEIHEEFHEDSDL